jgi:hypothetical protein
MTNDEMMEIGEAMARVLQLVRRHERPQMPKGISEYAEGHRVRGFVEANRAVDAALCNWIFTVFSDCGDDFATANRLYRSPKSEVAS